MIDTASFPTAEYAVERKEPVLQLMTVVEHMGDDAFLTRMVPRLLGDEPIEDPAPATPTSPSPTRRSRRKKLHR